MKKEDYELLLNIAIIASFTAITVIEFMYNKNMLYSKNLWYAYIIYKIFTIK